MYLQAVEGNVIQAGQIVLGSILKHQGVCPCTGLGFIASRPPALADEAVAGAGNRDRVSPVTKAPKNAKFYCLRHDQGSATAAPVCSLVDVPIGIDAVEGNAGTIPVFDVAGRAADIWIQVGANGMVAAAAAAKVYA